MEHLIDAVLHIFAFLLIYAFVIGVICYFAWLVCDSQIQKHIRREHREPVKDDAPAKEAV
ncbi:MAG: hypothetical protein ACOCYN_02495 [Planctomycetota bacterium]